MSYAPNKCPNQNCPKHTQAGGLFIKKGYFRIKRINQKIRKFQCKNCLKIFSSRTFKPDYRHKKMDLNHKLAKLLAEGNSLRSASRILKMTYFNTYKKFLWLKTIVDLQKNKMQFKASELQFDEMETIHHTKCKPLSIALVVNEIGELIEAKVAEMPAKGRLAGFSVNKYGPRKDDRLAVLNQVFLAVKSKLLELPQVIKSDANPSYKKIVKEYFSGVRYEQINRSDKIRHQDRLHERLSKKRFDPLFNVNHKCALLRSQIKRLTRRSWCTTKKPENLQLHLDLFIVAQSLSI
jgi:transposase-like protein